jgi:hypothetical protein
VVIIVIDNIGVAINKFKEYTPIAGYFHCMKALFIAAQLVEERTWVIHIFYFTCGIQPIKDSFKPDGMFGLNPSLATCIKKSSNPLCLKDFIIIKNVT